MVYAHVCVLSFYRILTKGILSYSAMALWGALVTNIQVRHGFSILPLESNTPAVITKVRTYIEACAVVTHRRQEKL